MGTTFNNTGENGNPEEHGFQLTEEVDILAWELGTQAEPRLPALPQRWRVSVEPVQDKQTIRIAREISVAVFGTGSVPSEEELEEEARQLQESIRAGNRIYFEFIARVDGQAASSAGLTLAGPVGRLWGAGTLPQYRGRGAYSALVLERCRTAHAYGAQLALVKARVGTSGPILRRGGFRAVGTERCFELAL